MANPTADDLKLDVLENLHNLPEGLLKAQIHHESGFNPAAVSPAGAVGVSQFMPATAKQYGIDPSDPLQSAGAQARMMGELLQKYNGDVPKALAAYNAGQGNVDRALVKASQDGSDWKEHLPKPQETIPYITKITKSMGGAPAPQQDITKKYSDVMEAAGNPPQNILDKYPEFKDQPPQSTPQEAPLMAQVGRGAKDAYQGVGQAAVNVAAKVGLVDPASADRYNKEVSDELSFYNKNNPGIQFGRMVGSAAAIPVMPEGVLATMGAMATMGAVQARQTNSRDYFTDAAKDAVVSGALGGLTKFGLDKVATPIVVKGYNFLKDNAAASALAKKEATDFAANEAAGVSSQPVTMMGRKVPEDVQATAVGPKEPLQQGSLPWQSSAGGVGGEAVPASKEQLTSDMVGEFLSKLKSNVGGAASKSIDEVSQRAAAGDEKAARVLNEIMQPGADADSIIKASGNLELFNRKAKAGELFDKAEQMAGTDNVKLNATNKVLDSMIAKEESAKLPDLPMIKMLKTARDNIAPQIKTIESPILDVAGKPMSSFETPNLTDNSYSKIRDLRSTIGDKLSSLYAGENGLVGPRSAGVISQIKDAISSDLNSFAEKKSPQMAELARDADHYYKTQVVPYKTQQLAKALKDAPADEIMNTFVKQGKEGRAEQFYSLLEPKGQAAVRYGIVNDAASNAMDVSTGHIDPLTFAKNLDKMDAPTKAFFKGEEYWKVQGLKNLMVHLSEKPEVAKVVLAPQRGPGVSAQQAPVDAVAKDVEGTVSKVGADILGSIPGLRVLLHTPMGKRFLNSASDLPPKSRAMTELTTSFVSKLASESIPKRGKNE